MKLQALFETSFEIFLMKLFFQEMKRLFFPDPFGEDGETEGSNDDDPK